MTKENEINSLLEQFEIDEEVFQNMLRQEIETVGEKKRQFFMVLEVWNFQLAYLLSLSERSQFFSENQQESFLRCKSLFLSHLEDYLEAMVNISNSPLFKLEDDSFYKEMNLKVRDFKLKVLKLK